MKLSQRAIIATFRFFLRAYFGLGLHRLWSNIHRFLFDRKWKGTKLPEITSLAQAAEKMSAFVWIKDGWREMFDAVCTPEKVQAVGFDGTSPHGNDCDEEAIWLTNIINNNMDNMQDLVIGADFFTAVWYEPGTGKLGGHNVCLLEMLDGWRYMDYGMPSKVLQTPEEVAELIAQRYAGWNSTGAGTQAAILIFWSRCDKNLKKLEMI